jgi:hypothetical protein
LLNPFGLEVTGFVDILLDYIRIIFYDHFVIFKRVRIEILKIMHDWQIEFLIFEGLSILD